MEIIWIVRRIGEKKIVYIANSMANEDEEGKLCTREKKRKKLHHQQQQQWGLHSAKYKH